MGHQINFCLLLCILFLGIGCSGSNFEEQEGPNVFYQVYPGKEDILRIRRTIGEGAPSIQLFDKQGKQLQKFTIAPMHVFNMTSVKNDSVLITYLVGRGDLEMFLPWFKTNRFNPERIGRYKINYNYEISNTYLESPGSQIDSVSVDKKAGTTTVFLKGKSIVTKPTFLFIIRSFRLQTYNPITQEYSIYTFRDKNLAEEFIEKILATYENE